VGSEMSEADPLEQIMEKVKDTILKILPPPPINDFNEIKDEVWRDLSLIYYKYETEEQKRAFRDVLTDISDKMVDDKWETIYKKLYREEKKS
jgi:hypothetical protein